MKMKILIAMFLILFSEIGHAQKTKETVLRSSMLGMDLPSQAFRDKGIFNVSAAKTLLEIEASPEDVHITEVEVLTFLNQTGEKEASTHWINQVEKIIIHNNFERFSSSDDVAYLWIFKNEDCYLVYRKANKKEAALYIGRADKLPEKILAQVSTINVQTNYSNAQSQSPISNLSNPHPVSQFSNAEVESNKLIPELVGNWGTLSGAKVNWRDESTGYMLVSGISKGYGMELKADGNFLQSTVVTSGRPNYRVFVSTTGEWEVVKDKLIFYPKDRHYRKWENEIIMVDEHSIPETYEMYWHIKINKTTGKQCLCTRYESDSEFNELCSE